MKFNVAKALLNLWKIFVYSLHGLRDTVHHEMAFHIELSIAVILTPAALILPVSPIVQILLISAVFLILIVELVNTGIETVVN